MHLIQLLLPLYDNEGRKFAPAKLNAVKQFLAKRFGGVTLFKRAPAEGLSRGKGGMKHDQIVVFEVMAERLERRWWGRYRKELEQQFRQDTVLIRAAKTDLL